MNDAAQFISASPLFYSLPRSIVEQIAGKVQLLSYPPDTFIFHDGDPGDSFYIIRSGHVKVVKASQDQAGEDLVMAVLDPGEVFGEMALLIGQPRSAAVKTMDGVEVFRLMREDFSQLMRENPELLVRMNHVLDQRVSLLDTSPGGSQDALTREKFRSSHHVEVDHIMLDLIFKLNMAAGGTEQIEHCKQTAILAQEMSKMLCPMVSEEIISGAYLHEIGKISLSKTLVEKERSGQELTAEESEEFSKIWKYSSDVLEPLHSLQRQVNFINFLGKERYDEMPIEAQILKAADDYQELIYPHCRNRSGAEALERIRAGAGTRYNPKVVTALERTIEKFNAVLVERQQSYMRCINRALDIKDSYTLSHSIHTQEMSLRIGERLGLGKREMDMLSLGGELHDVGKIFIEQEILNAPRKLTAEEFDIMKKHPVWSADFFTDVPGMDELASIVRHHHEKMDGSGYPDGWKGGQIPFLSRIMAVGDVYSALTTPRVYRLDEQGQKKAFPLEKALEIMDGMQPGHFDGAVFEAFKGVVLVQGS